MCCFVVSWRAERRLSILRGRACRRGLLTSEQVEEVKPLLDELGPRLNAYLRSIGPVESDASDGGPVRSTNDQ